jgi:phage-related protein
MEKLVVGLQTSIYLKLDANQSSRSQLSELNRELLLSREDFGYKLNKLQHGTLVYITR